MFLVFLKSKVLLWNINKKCNAIKVYIEIPSLAPSIMDRSMASSRPMQIYTCAGILVLRFKWSAMQNYCNANVIV